MKLLKGQSLIEVIIVVAMTSAVLLALVALGNIAIRNTTLTIQRSEAIKLASSAMEAVRYVRDTQAVGCNYSGLMPGPGPYCMDINISDVTPGCRSTNPSPQCICNSLILKTPCSADPPITTYGQYNIENTDFNRIIIVTAGSEPDTAKIDVKIKWPVGNSMQDYTLTTIMTSN